MDNNFEQDFIQNIKSDSPQSSPAPAKPPRPTQSKDKKNLTIVLIVIIFAQSLTMVLLAVLLVISLNRSQVVEYNDDTPSYSYNDDGSIRTMSLTCESEQGYYVFYPSGDYEKYSVDFNERQDMGTYSVVDGSSILINNEGSSTSRKLSFTDNIVNDGAVQYNCNSNAEYGDD